LTNNTSLALQTTDGKVMASKNMYNVDENNCIDISLFVSTCEEIESVLILKLIDTMKKRNLSYVNTNLWIKCDNVSEYFDIVWQRNRVVFGKKVNKPTVKKSTDDLITKTAKSNSSILK